MKLFKNSSEALVFAFRFSSQQYALSPMAKMMKTGVVGSGKGLVSLDGAGQAGMIRKHVDTLPSFQRSCIIARYSTQFEDCKCCGGQKMIDEYREAVANLADGWAMQHLTGISIRGMRHAIVRAYYERGISIRHEAERLNVAKSTAYDQKSVIWNRLKELDGQAQRHIEDLLEPMCGEQEQAA